MKHKNEGNQNRSMCPIYLLDILPCDLPPGNCDIISIAKDSTNYQRRCNIRLCLSRQTSISCERCPTLRDRLALLPSTWE